MGKRGPFNPCIMFLLFTCLHFWASGTLRRWSACVPITCEVDRDCGKFDKHCLVQYEWEMSKKLNLMFYRDYYLSNLKRN
jgi:hypothetical protein